MPTSATHLLRLERLLTDFGPDATEPKLAALAALERARLGSARAVLRLHEALVLLRAYPDDGAVLARVERMLARFDRRADLRAFRDELADSGVAGTDIHFPFFHPQASWLARRHGAALHVDWEGFEHAERLRGWLEAAIEPAEVPALYDVPGSVREWVARLKGGEETDAQYVVRALESSSRSTSVQRAIHDGIEVPYRVDGRAGAPSRTSSFYPGSPIVERSTPLVRGRPDLAEAACTPPLAVREVPRAEGRALIELAREAMMTRSRDLDSFSYGSADDVRMVELGDGLQLACIGLVPEQRIVVEALYAFLMLQSGVPTGYAMCSALYRSSDVAYNVFETFRGAEAAHVYGRVLGAVRALFGSNAFCVTPYQLGHGNEEGLASGAWWFYQKLGFRPRDPKVAKLMRAELARMKRDSRHRSSRATLTQLSSKYVYWFLDAARDDVIGLIPLERISLAASRYLSDRFGSARARGRRVTSEEAAQRVGVRGWRKWSPDERRAWERWAPLVLLLPGVEGWSAEERHDLAEVVRAKGGRRESDYLELFDRHERLKRALLAVAKKA